MSISSTKNDMFMSDKFQAPMADLWHYIDVGLKVEVENTDSYDFCEEFPNSFWIASVLRVEGEENFIL